MTETRKIDLQEIIELSSEGTFYEEETIDLKDWFRKLERADPKTRAEIFTSILGGQWNVFKWFIEGRSYNLIDCNIPNPAMHFLDALEAELKRADTLITREQVSNILNNYGNESEAEWKKSSVYETCRCESEMNIVPLLERFVALGLDVNNDNIKFPHTLPLHYVAGKSAAFAYLFPLTHNVDSPSGEAGKSPVESAASAGNLESVKLCMESGKVVVPDSITHAAVAGGHIHVLDYLLSQGKKFGNIIESDNAVTGNELHYAAASWHSSASETVEYLLAHGMQESINEKNKEGKTALHLAMRRKQPSVVRALLAHGADVNAKDAEGNTPLDDLCKQKPRDTEKYAWPEVLLELLEAGAKRATGPDDPFALIESRVLPDLAKYEDVIEKVRSIPPRKGRNDYEKRTERREYARFASVVYKLNGMVTCIYRPQMKVPSDEEKFREPIRESVAQILSHAPRATWGDLEAALENYHVLGLRDVKDTVRNLTKALVLPELLLALPPDKARELGYGQIGTIIEKLMPAVLEAMLADKGANIPKMSELFHGEQYVLAEKTREFSPQGSWRTIFAETDGTIEITGVPSLAGYTLVDLTHSGMLDRVGEAMDTCIGGHTDSCMAGKFNVVALMDPEGHPISTLRMSVESGDINNSVEIGRSQGRLYLLEQARAHNRGPMPPKALEAKEWLFDKIKKGKIAIEREPGVIANESNMPHLENTIGFKAEDFTEATYQKLFKAYATGGNIGTEDKPVVVPQITTSKYHLLSRASVLTDPKNPQTLKPVRAWLKEKGLLEKLYKAVKETAPDVARSLTPYEPSPDQALPRAQISIY